MTSNANLGAERPQPSPGDVSRNGAVAGANPSGDGQGADTREPGEHHPEAKALLHRYLSEIHGYRQLGNAALSELERRLDAMSDAAAHLPQGSREGAASQMMRPSIRREEPADAKASNLTDRLRELSSYLHADLTRQQNMQADLQADRDEMSCRAAPRKEFSPRVEPAARPENAQRALAGHKPTPTAPVLDRAWFEERFAAMRASIDQLAEQIPTKRLTLLENQFHQLMEKLEARETDRSRAAVESGLKKLAAYLEDNRHWTRKQDARVRGVEDRLDQLSGLVAQSHAALSATAKGLEIVARGTGRHLARTTADLVAEKLEPRMKELDQRAPLKELSGEVGKLAEESKRLISATDERVKQLQHSFDEGLDRLENSEKPECHLEAEEGWHSRIEKDQIDNEYDGRALAAARNAARFAEHRERAIPQDGGPVRHQIPYGEFLPEEERASSRTGLVVAAIILLLASAAMLYLNLRERSSGATLSSAWLSSTTQGREDGASSASPVTTVYPAAEIDMQAVRTLQPQGRFGKTPRIADTKSLDVSVPDAMEEVSPGAHAAAAEPAFSVVGGRPAQDQPSLNSSTKAGSLRVAAIAGDVDAQFSIGENYLQGRNVDRKMPVTERLSKAARWFRRAAEKGHAPSQYRLATLYELGRGAPKDHAESMFWYRRAAESGHVKAMHNLAVLSIAGRGRTANYPVAAKWFTKAAEYGLADSQYNLGVLYERGLGVPKDLAAAYHWFSLASIQGDKKAVQKREGLARHLSGAVLEQERKRTLGWAAEEIDQAVNSKAPEPPVEQPKEARATAEPQMPSTQVLHGIWNARITRLDTATAEAQRLLKQLGFKPGPVDGIVGPKTVSAVRAFERKNGLPSTGRITDLLIAKMAFALPS